MYLLDLPYPKVRLTNTTADGYLYQIIQDEEADIVINIDEDAFVFDLNRLNELIKFMIENDYANCGMPDGGIVQIRHLNPLVTNPYFNVFNVREIRKKFRSFDINTYSSHKDNYMNNYPTHILKGAYEFVYYEPYYPLFVWMSQNFKTLYLDAEEHTDHYSTSLKNHLGKPFLVHTWYSRLYNVDKAQTNRINDAIHYCEKYCGRTYNPSIKELISTTSNSYFYQIKSDLIKIKRKIFGLKIN
jgi:hypothetical protein